MRALWFLVKRSNPYYFGVQLWAYRSLVIAMAVRETQGRYIGTFGGMLWMVGHPLATITIYWLVFSIGLKVEPSGDVPFVVFLVCGIVPWLTFSESLMSSVNAITGAPHLVKKVAFPTSILPVVHLLVSMVSHLAMLVILLVLLILNGVPFSWGALQAVYYLGALYVLSLGIGWLVASVNVFSRDVANGLSVVIGFWFWLTPIVWPASMLGEYSQWLMLNPLYYIVDGYRDAFLGGGVLWDKGVEHLAYWGICLILFVAGGRTFQKLQPEFAEVL